MYIPKHNAETNIETLQALIRSHPLGAWVTMGEHELLANHIPFFLDASRGQYGTLVAHVARANPAWQQCSKTIPSVVLFQGAERYITPSWYPSKQMHGKTVPTWNYVVVHAHGIPSIIEDRAWLLENLNRLTDQQEGNRTKPWKISEAPSDHIERLLGAIVGLEIPLTALVGKWKVSQDKTEADRQGVAAGLSAFDDIQAQEMAFLVENHWKDGQQADDQARTGKL